MFIGCESNQKFLLAMSLVGLLFASLILDAFGFKPSDILIGGIIGAVGAATQDFFSNKRAHSAQAENTLNTLADKVPPLTGEAKDGTSDQADQGSSGSAGEGSAAADGSDSNPWPFDKTTCVGEKGQPAV